MIDFDLIFQNNPQSDKIQLHKSNWINLGNINDCPPELLINCVKSFANDVNAKSLDDLQVCANPSNNILDVESSNILSNILATIMQRLGDNNAKIILKKAVSQ